MAIAVSQCSTRRYSPYRADGQRAMSPAATTPGAARRVSSQTTPSSTSSPDPANQSTLGITPMPMTTTSASMNVPSASRTPSTRSVPSSPSTPTPSRTSTPWSRWRSAMTDADPGPEGAFERHLGRLEQRDVEAAAATRRRHLRADEAGSDDDDPTRVLVERRRAGACSRRANAGRARRRAPRCAAATGPTRPSRSRARRSPAGRRRRDARTARCDRGPWPAGRGAGRVRDPRWRRAARSDRDPTRPRAPASTEVDGRRAWRGRRRRPRCARRSPRGAACGRRASRRGTHRRPRSNRSSGHLEAPCRPDRRGHSSTIEMACLGQRCTASSIFGRMSSGGVSFKHVEEVVVAHLEHLRCDPHADRVALAQVEVDHHSHLGPLGWRCADYPVGRVIMARPPSPGVRPEPVLPSNLTSCQIWP